MKKSLLIIFSMCFSICLLSGCGKTSKDYNEITEFLKNIENYSSDVKIILKNNKQKIAYDTVQIYNKSLGHIVNLNNERIFIYKDQNIYVKDIKNDKVYVQDNDFDKTFRLSFISEYVKMLYTNEQINYSYESIDDKEYMLIHYFIPGVNRNFSEAVLYINSENMKPKKVYIYDKDGIETMEVVYENFKIDEEIDNSLFDIDHICD